MIGTGSRSLRGDMKTKGTVSPIALGLGPKTGLKEMP